MLRALICLMAVLALSACVSEPKDPSFIGARAFDSEEAAKTRISLGLTYLKNGNFSQAKLNLDKALEFAPRNGQAHFAMAFYYQQVDELELAEESYEKALGFSKNDPDIVNSYGAFLCKQGKYEKAKNYFLRAVNSKNYVSTAETYENLAICSQNQGLNEEAIEYFLSALNHQPTRGQSLYLLTRLYIEQEQWEQAKRTLFKYERSAPVSAETLYMQFQIAQGVNDTKTAVGYGEILKSMFPEHPNTEKYLVQMGKFKPSATVTQKIREQTNTQTHSSLDAQALARGFTTDGAGEQVDSAIPVAEYELTDEIPPIVIIDTTEPENTTVPTLESSQAQAQEAASELDISEDMVQNTVEVPESRVTEIADSEGGESVKSDTEIEAALADVFDSDPQPSVRDYPVEPALDDDAYHTVLPKENLYRISLKYNVKMRKLLEWNGLTDASEIQMGTKLRVRNPNNNE